MQEQQQRDIVTALLVDGDRRLRAMVQTSAQTQDMVEMCAVVPDAERALALLEAGLRPAVLVVDTMLPGCGMLGMLQKVPQIDPGYKPRILVSTVQVESDVIQRLLTLGACSVILKPYTPTKLFEEILLAASTPQMMAAYHLRRHLDSLLLALRVGTFSCGVRYLEHILNHLVLEDELYTLEELYAAAAQEEHLSRGAVVTAIRRLAGKAYGAGTPLYAQLCLLCGKPEDARLTNKDFIYSIAARIRQMMYR